MNSTLRTQSKKITNTVLFYDIILKVYDAKKYIQFTDKIRALRNMLRSCSATAIIVDAPDLPYSLHNFLFKIFKYAERNNASISLCRPILITSFSDHRIYNSRCLTADVLFLKSQSPALQHIGTDLSLYQIIQMLQPIQTHFQSSMPFIINYCASSSTYTLHTTHYFSNSRDTTVQPDKHIQQHYINDLKDLINMQRLIADIVNDFIAVVVENDQNFALLKTTFYQTIINQQPRITAHYVNGVRNSLNQCRFIFVPIYVHAEEHYILLVVDKHEGKIFSYDSCNQIRTAVMKIIADTIHSYNITSTLITNYVDVPCSQQTNGVDCGVFVCQFAYLIHQNLPPDVDPMNVPSLRHYIFRVLMHRSFNFTSAAGKDRYINACNTLEITPL